MADPKRPVPIALIGSGRMGSIYARLADELADTQLVAVCGQSEAKALALAQSLGAPGYANGQYRQMLADHPHIEAVIVSASEWAHVDPVLTAIAAGKHVLVEKPMATSLADGQRMAAQAAQAGVHLLVCHSLRFDPRYAAMRDSVRRGDIGEPLHLYARRNAPQQSVERVVGKFPLSFWLMPHDIDMALWTVGQPVVRVHAFAKAKAQARHDFIIAVLTFAGGAVAVLESSWATPAHPGRAMSSLFTVRGTAGTVDVMPYENGVARFGPGTVEYPDTGYTPIVQGQVEGSFRSLVRHFAGVVRGRWQPAITADDGLAVLRIADAVDRALQTGDSVDL